MSATHKPRKSGRSGSPRTSPSASDKKLLASLVRRGIVRRGPTAGEAFPEELLEPGPTCPGAVDALLADRR